MQKNNTTILDEDDRHPVFVITFKTNFRHRGMGVREAMRERKSERECMHNTFEDRHNALNHCR